MDNNSILTKEELLIKINQLESKVFELEVSLATISQKKTENSTKVNNQFLESERQITNRAIYEKKKAQKALKQSEAIIRNKLKAITDPNGDMGTLELSDIIDVEVLQSMMNDFYQLTGMLGAVLDVSGKVLVAVGWQDICTKFHRCNKDTLKNCIESDTALTKNVPEGTFKAYRCKNNMWDIVTPIIVGEKHVGNVFMGQYFLQDEKPDVNFFKEQAKKYGFNEKEYLAALNRAPRFSKEAVNTGMEFYSKLAKLISNLSFSAIQQSKLLAKQKLSEQSLKESKERFELAMIAAKDGIYDWNLETKEIYYSPGWKNMLGYYDDELPNDFAVWKKLTEPKDLQRSWNIIKELINNQRNRFEIEFKMKHKEGHWVDVLSRAEAVFNDDGKAVRMVGTHVDISERKLEEKIVDVELKLFEYAVNHSEEELLQKFLDEVEKLTSSTIGFYHYIEEDQESISLQTWSSNTINSMCNRTANVDHHYPISKAGVWVDCIKERKPVIHNDYVNLIHKKGLPEAHSPIVRELVVPVIRDNQIVAVLGVGNKKTNYNETDVKIAQRLADLAWETAIRKQAEEKLKNTFDISPSIIAKVNVKTGYFVDVNQAVTRILGYSIEEFKSKPLIEFIYPDDIQQTADQVIEQINGNKTSFFENRYLCKDGSYKWLAWHSTKVDQHGIVTAIASDITEQKKTEGNIRKLSTAVQQSPSIIMITDTKGKIEYINPKFTELTGYSNSDAIGHPSNILNSGKQDPEFYKELWATVKSGNVWRGQFRNEKKNGELFWEAASISAILNESGEIINFIKIGEDITQQKKTEEKLTIALEKALESDRLKSAFLSNMSHEIRTPMNGILGFINLLNKPNLSQSQISEYSAIINKSGDRLLNTINDIIDISKIEAGEVIISIAETPINTLIEELYSFFLPEASRKGLTLKLAPSILKENLSINTDSHKLHGILTNLIKNAIKYTKEGTITLGYIFKQNFIEFFVKDTGIGIPKNRLQAIFNRFEQADIEDSNVFEGSGLGLAISKAYTKMLGGKISVESTEGIGSIFKFTIPHNIKKNIEMEKQFDYTENITSEIEHLNLLIVEDDVVSSYFLETILEDDFKKINTVENGIEAIEYCKNNQEIDLVLMDIKMPVMNGYDATKEIRKFNKDLLIIAQTAYAMQGDKEKAIEAGCNDYIVKPINKELLLKTINKLIE